MTYPWLNIIAAMTYRDQVIGLYNQLPWPRLSKDMKRFKELTLNSPVIMGHNTFKSLNNKPLSERENIILSHSRIRIPCYNENVFLSTVQDCLDYVCMQSIDPGSDGKVWVIGGSQIYQQFLPYTNKLYLTVINQKFYGDKYFPEIDLKVWERENLEKVEGDVLPYQFEIWRRKQ